MSRRGGTRPGAGRPQNPLDGAPSAARPPRVGDVVLVVEPTWPSPTPFPGLVIRVARPGDPASPLNLAVFRDIRPNFEVLRDVPHSAEPGGIGCRSWPRAD